MLRGGGGGDGGGGGIIGTPLDVLPARTGLGKPGPSRQWRPGPAERIAPRASEYARSRDDAARRAEHDALRDVYRPVDSDHAAAPPVARTVEELMDGEDRAHARRRHGKGDGAQIFSDSSVIVPKRTHVSVGHAILRAQGIGDEGDGVSIGQRFVERTGGSLSSELATERRRKYRLGDLFSAAERGSNYGRDRAGVGFVDPVGPARALSPVSGSARGRSEQKFDRDMGTEEVSRGLPGRHIRFQRGNGNQGDRDILDEGDDNEFGDAPDGSLHDAVNRMKAAMFREKRALPSRSSLQQFAPGEEVGDLDGPLSRLFDADSSQDVAGTLHNARDGEGRQGGEAYGSSDLRVPSSFASNPVHDWASDPFTGTGSLSRAPDLALLVDKVSAVEREKVSVVGANVAARRRATVEWRLNRLREAQATAGAGLKSSFVRRGEASVDHRPDHPKGISERNASYLGLEEFTHDHRKMGDVSRKQYGWEPSSIVCKRLDIPRPVVPISDREVEQESHKEQRRDKWRLATGFFDRNIGNAPGKSLDGPSSAMSSYADSSVPSQHAPHENLGEFRVTSIVSKDGQVAVVQDDADIDSYGAVVISDPSTDGPRNEDDRTTSAGENHGAIDSSRSDAEKDSEIHNALACDAVRHAVFGRRGAEVGYIGAGEKQTSDAQHSDDAKTDGHNGEVRKRRWRAVDFF